MKDNLVSVLKQRPLGQTNIQVSPIGLGLMELSGGGGLYGRAFPIIPPEEKNAMIQAALDGGVNWFDTAELYGNGVSERALAQGLRAAGVQPGGAVIATKWWPVLRTARSIAKNIEERKRFLDGFPVDLYYVHQPYGFSSPEAEMNAMADLVEAGKIRAVGVSNFDAPRLRRAHAALSRRGIPLATNQVLYSLVDRHIETDGTLEAARELGVTITAYTPLGSGLLTGKYHENPELIRRKSLIWRASIQKKLDASYPLIMAMRDIAGRYDATPAQVALNWLIHFQGDLVVTIPGASSARQSADNAAAMRFKLSPEEMALLDDLSQDFR